MDFRICSQAEVAGDPKLAAFLLDTIIGNLSYLYGPDMGSEENRQSWIAYNLQRKDDSWHAIVGSRQGLPLGFVICTVKDRALCVNDIEILPAARRNPALLSGLLRRMLEAEDFDTVTGHIHRNNLESQRNFLKYATEVSETPNGYRFTIGPEAVKRIKARTRGKKP